VEHRALTPLSLLLLIALLVPTVALAADDDGPAVTFHPYVQERVRFEVLPDKTFASDAVGSWQIANRARLGLEGRYGKVISGYVEIQDVRTWGSEYNAGNMGEGTLFDWVANGLDISQAYGEVRAPDKSVRVRAGRQEIAWHGQRLIGSVLWAHQGRSFDGVRVYGEKGQFGYDAFYAVLLNRPVAAADTFNRWEDGHLVAFRAGPRLGDVLDLDGLAIVNLDQGTEKVLATFGAHAQGKAGAFSYEAEVYGQAGEDTALSYAAWMVGLRAGATLEGGPTPYIGGGFDMLSGDKDPADSTVRVFDTLYATNHKFYGHMDAYLAIPAHTRGEGLIDGMLNTRFELGGGARLSFDAHVFASAAPQGEAFHGVEFDTNFKIKPIKPLVIMAGFWIYVPGEFWNDDPKPEIGLYASTDFRFK